MIIPSPAALSNARIFSLAGLLPDNPSQSRADQVRSVFERMEAALQDEGMTFAHVVRTWFFMDDILGWYDQFNTVRNSFFRDRRVFGGLVPASTGVGMPNADGAALVGGLLAIHPRSTGVRAFAVPSPLQCPALDYSSAFSRAVEVHVPGERHLYISGTASIGADGASLFAGDLDAQIARTMAVVEAILASRNMTWSDARRSVAYFPDLKDAPRFAAYCRSFGLPGLTAIPVQATICRKELLFEIELDAVSRSEAP